MLRKNAKSLDPNKHAVLYDAMTAKAYFSAENYGQAEIYYKKCIEIEPNEDPFIITSAQYISETLLKNSNPEQRHVYLQKAIDVGLKAIELEPNDPPPYVNLAIDYNAINKYQDARDVLNRWKGPNSGDIEYEKSATEALTGNSTSAIAFLKSAIEMNRENAVNALADDDFEFLRRTEAFTSILSDAMPKPLLDAAIRAWAEKEKWEALDFAGGIGLCAQGERPQPGWSEKDRASQSIPSFLSHDFNAVEWNAARWPLVVSGQRKSAASRGKVMRPVMNNKEHPRESQPAKPQ